MKLYARENDTDSDMIELYYFWNNKKWLFAVVCSDCFDSDLQHALVENEDETFDLEFELRLI